MSMLNLLAFAVMVGLGIYSQLPVSYYVFLAIGSLLGAFAGFASFSRGTFYARGRGEVMTALAILVAACLAVAIGWLHGLWWGIGSFILFWPVMYRLGVRLLMGIPEPGFASPGQSAVRQSAIQQQVASRGYSGDPIPSRARVVVNSIGRTPEFDNPHDLDEWLLGGGQTFERREVVVGQGITTEEVEKWRDRSTNELYAVFTLVDDEWARTYVTRQVFDKIRQTAEGSRQSGQPADVPRPPCEFSSIVLEQDDWEIEIQATEWRNILDFLQRRGWAPTMPVQRFLEHGCFVNAAEAEKFQVAVQTVQEEALTDPMSFYPVPVDMGVLAEVATMCEEGPFQIRQAG